MRVSYNWLKDYVEFDLSPKVLAKELTKAGIAVENIEDLAEGIKNVVVGQILEISPHPNADRLLVCRVLVGDNKLCQIVTGATNVRIGQLVAVAMDGAVLPGNKSIHACSFKGVLSEGMMCSAQELGLDTSGLPEVEAMGIMEMPPGSQPGERATKVLGLEDWVLVLELTPNRADCLSLINVAREVAAITGAKLRIPEVNTPYSNRPSFARPSVTIEATDLCGRYVAMVIENVRVSPSPAWLRQRLMAAGIRPINNIVDITNYVMLETGQPLHAFDYDTIAKGSIIVRRGRDHESIVSLDGVTRSLKPDFLVIADAERPVAIAGIMGGLETEITESTKHVLLESAYFDSTNTRKTSKALGLRSEASLRFEKGVDINGCLFAAQRAAQMMAELAAGEVMRDFVDEYIAPWQPTKINLRIRRINEVLGTALTLEEIRAILERLNLEPEKGREGELCVQVPSYRRDLSLEIDLIEEIARIYGYDRIPTTLPVGKLGGSFETVSQKVEDLARRTLVSCGVSEAITYSFIDTGSFNKLLLPPDHKWRNVVEIKNPLGEEQSVMRSTLIPGLLDAASRNVSRRATSVALFEVGRVYFPKTCSNEPLPEEKLHVAALVSGKLDKVWRYPVENLDFFFLKGILETFLKSLALGNYLLVPAREHPFLHPGRAANIELDGQTLGYIGELHPFVQESYGLPARTCLFEMNMGSVRIESIEAKKYSSIPRFPSIKRDIAIMVSEETPTGEIEKLIAEAGGTWLNKIQLFDLYQGEQICVGKKSLAYTLTYQSHERTLTDEDVKSVHNKVIDALRNKFEAEIR
ncbi:MAG: phenylalanine--tRNA ligase subunit beta [Bacillota bacterium]